MTAAVVLLAYCNSALPETEADEQPCVTSIWSLGWCRFIINIVAFQAQEEQGVKRKQCPFYKSLLWEEVYFFFMIYFAAILLLFEVLSSERPCPFQRMEADLYCG